MLLVWIPPTAFYRARVHKSIECACCQWHSGVRTLCGSQDRAFHLSEALHLVEASHSVKEIIQPTSNAH